jgi:hypothetical protein
MPGRPLVLALGSSRTKWALRAEQLNHPSDRAAPLVLNWGANGGGSMLAQTFLRRALEAGIRPDVVFLEVLPLSLSARRGLPFEEGMLCPWRLTAAEAAQLRPYYLRPHRFDLRWLGARALPIGRHHIELREALTVDAPSPGRRQEAVPRRDSYGWSAAQHWYPADEVQRLTGISLTSFQSALTQPRLAPGASQAVRDTVRLCLEQQIGVVLVIPPEGTVFRHYAPTVSHRHTRAVYALAQELGVPLIDASKWVDDDGFIDGHHTNFKGADQYTERFGREALRPHLLASPRISASWRR